jgi:hypothetical protein
MPTRPLTLPKTPLALPRTPLVLPKKPLVLRKKQRVLRKKQPRSKPVLQALEKPVLGPAFLLHGTPRVKLARFF